MDKLWTVMKTTAAIGVTAYTAYYCYNTFFRSTQDEVSG